MMKIYTYNEYAELYEEFDEKKLHISERKVLKKMNRPVRIKSTRDYERRKNTN
jgi:hypothetical protein